MSNSSPGLQAPSVESHYQVPKLNPCSAAFQHLGFKCGISKRTKHTASNHRASVLARCISPKPKDYLPNSSQEPQGPAWTRSSPRSQPFFLKQEVLKAPFAWSVKLGATVSGSSLSQTFRITTLGFHTPELLALGPDPNEHRERAKHDYNAIVYVIGILLQHDFNLLITSTLPFNWAYMMMQCF